MMDQPTRTVTAGPHFPIGYTISLDDAFERAVTAGPHFPIGYTRYWIKVLLTRGFSLFRASKNWPYVFKIT